GGAAALSRGESHVDGSSRVRHRAAAVVHPSRPGGPGFDRRRRRPADGAGIDHLDFRAGGVHADAHPDARRARRHGLRDQDPRRQRQRRPEDRDAGRRAVRRESGDSMNASPGEAVVADGLEKRFGHTIALAGLSFSVPRAELFGFVGPDGGGKTTLFRILATLLVPEKGAARVLDRDVVKDLWDLRRRIGYMPGRFSLYPDLSVYENLRFFAAVFGTTIEREHGHIAPIYSQLESFKDRRAAALSGGMKQKLALCCALVHRPEILFLDEPTTGVDAVSRREFWDLLAQ